METRELLFQSLNNCWVCKYGILSKCGNYIERCDIKDRQVSYLLMLTNCDDIDKLSYKEYLEKVEIDK